DGRRLPTEAELAERHRVSRQTVRRAFQDLVAEGLVYRVPGRGTFARPREGGYLRPFGSVEDLMALSVYTRMDITVPLHRRGEVAGRRGPTGDAVGSVAFRRLHDGVPFCLTTVCLPPHVGALLRDVPELAAEGASSAATVIGLLDTRLAAPIAEADQSITVAAADPPAARHLGCAPGHPLLRIDRLYRDTEGTPVELAVSLFLPEQYSYRTRLRRSVT